MDGPGVKNKGGGRQIVDRAIDEETRQNMANGKLRNISAQPQCRRNIWRSGEHWDPDDVFREITSVRGEECFFYPFTEGMTWDAAEELERRTASSREAEKDRKLTRRAF